MHDPSPAQQPVPPPPDLPPSGGRSVRSRWIIGVAGLVSVLIVVNVVLVQILFAGTANEPVIAAGAGEFEVAESTTYEYAEPILDVDPDGEVTFPVHYGADFLPAFGQGNIWGHSIRVFIDAALTVEVPEAVAIDYEPWDNQFVVRPPRGGGVSAGNSLMGGEFYLSRSGEWGLSDEYFVVEYRDRDTGATLERPLVTRVTVAVQTPRPEVASFRVDDEGVGHITWSEVDGAANYYVVRVGGRQGVELIGMTSNTTWSTIEQDESVQEARARFEADRTDPGVLEQNRALRQHRYAAGEDRLRDEDSLDVAEAELDPLTVGVIAVVGSRASAMTIAATGAETAALPRELATNAARELGVTSSDVNTVDQIPTDIPMTMTDGRTVLRAVVIDPDDVWEDETAAAGRTIKRVPFRVDGTLLRGIYSIGEYDDATFDAELAAIIERNAQSRERTGGGQTYTYLAEARLSEGTISREAPEVPYQVNATNSFTGYLAANLLAGNEFIDVSAYVDNPAGIGLYDALDEAVYQNPMIGRIYEVKYLSAEQALAINYRDSRESIVAEQEAVAAEVARIIDEIVTDGMSDREKVQAINDHIRGIVTYNYEALDQIRTGAYLVRQWEHARTGSAAGALLDGSAVCAGYADAFKVLADAADLEAVVVNGVGTSSGERHAWNKVNVDGTWRMIDVTWNDSDAAPNAYFLLTDVQSAESHEEHTDWIMDSLIGNFAAH